MSGSLALLHDRASSLTARLAFLVALLDRWGTDEVFVLFAESEAPPATSFLFLAPFIVRILGSRN